MTTASFNLNLPGYQPIEEIYRDSKTVVYRAEQMGNELGEDPRFVVIKLLSLKCPSYQDLLKFRRQYTISKNLNVPGIVRSYSLEEYEQGYMLVMEDFGGIDLNRYRQEHRLPLADILDFAVQLADILHALCQQRIVHKDIKPANILINPTTKQIKLIDFSIASLLPIETQVLLDPNLLEGTLAYLSPEQTGRMNRGIDYRSDFYALGVTLYELLTGKLPFEADDPMELIHCHLARVAIPACQLDRSVPVTVSEIVAKLIAKNAEDRYQSALGLKYDLEKCLHQLQTTGTITDFEIGERDISDRFIVPEKLYGRETEVQTLLDAFDRVAGGSSELMLVAGASGIGKTAVINEIHKPITRQHGYFISGKYDQFNRNIPLSAFIRALRDLASQLLSENDIRLATWKSNILAVVGENGRVLIEVIPELEQIIGSQPVVAELSGTAARSRFNWLFQKFIEVLATAEHPLTIFLDDLQWADLASLQLIKLLMEGQGHLFLLGAYRDNEVSSMHPLMSIVNELQKARKNVQIITLMPLNFDDVNRSIADTLHCSIEGAKSLTELIDRKTQGNPFFITQFLKALHADGEIWFNSNGGYWECDLVRVQSQAITDDVVEFMAAQLQKLPPETQQVLKLAACLGDRFDLDTLAIVSEQSPVNTETALWEALAAGLILPTSQIYQFYQDLQDLDDLQDCGAGVNRSPGVDLSIPPHPNSPTPQLPHTPTPQLRNSPQFRFRHDRVQQAAYSSIPTEQRESTYLKIGRLLLENTSVAARAEQIFRIVDRVNIGRGLITELAERDRLLQLNFQAAQKAQRSNAYVAAAEYLEICIELLPTDSWHSQPKLIQQIYTAAIEVAYLGTNYDRMEQLIAIFLSHTVSSIEQIRVYEIQMLGAKAQGKLPASIQIGRQLLQSIGIEFPVQPTPADIEQALAKSFRVWQDRSIASLIDLPMMTDPIDLVTMRILTQMIPSAYQSAPMLMPLLIFKQIELSIASGNCDVSPFIYADYGLVLCGIVGDVDAGCQFGQLALNLVDLLQLTTAKCRTYFIVHGLISHWQASLSSRLPFLREGHQLGLETGDLESSALNAQMYCAYAYFAGQELSSLATEMETYRQGIARLKQETAVNYHAIYHQTVLNLLGQSEDPCQLIGSAYNEVQVMPLLQQNHYRSALYYLHFNKTVLAYLFDRAQLASDCAILVESYADSVVGMFAIPLFCFYRALIDLKLCPSMTDLARAQCLDKVAIDLAKMQKWADFAPMNHLHKLHLVEAELNRVLGNKAKAIELYDLAISAAKTHGYIQEKALANELAAKFYLDWGKSKIAASYMQEAYYCYSRWGSKAKTDHLEQSYPQLLAPILAPQQTAFNSLSSFTTITHSFNIKSASSQEVNTFDLVSVLQSAQALSRTIELEELIHQLTQIILKNSGAETCILVLPNAEDRWQVRSIATVNSGCEIGSQLEPNLPDRADYPAKLIYSIKNQQQIAIFNARQSLEIPDPYLLEHQPQSVFGLPILKQGAVLGVLYLEHRHAPDIFTENHKIVISFLCTQAAIALENARLYQESQIAAVNLRIEQSYLAALLDNIPHIAWIKDEQSRFIAVNQPFAEAFGCEASELVGKNDFDLAAIELAQKYRDDDWRVMASGERQTLEEIIVNAQGEPRWLETIKTPIRNSDGKITGTVGIALDITDRLKIQADLSASRQKYYDLIQSIDGVVWEYDLIAGKFSFVSDRAAALLGYPIEEWLSTPNFWHQHIHPEDFDAAVTAANPIDPDRGTCEVEYRLIAADGRIVWVYDTFTLVRDAAGRPIATHGLLLDITDRKMMEITLSKSEDRYTQMATNVPGTLYQFEITADGTYKMNYLSPRCSELFELSRSAVLADVAVMFDRVMPEDRDSFVRSLAESARSREPWTWEGRWLMPSGQIKWMNWASRQTYMDDGSIVWNGIVMDVTERQAALHERDRAQIDLLASKQFLQTVLDSFPLYIFWKDRHSVYLGGNQKFVMGTGLSSAAELVGKTDDDMPWDTAEADAYRADDREVIDTEIAKLGIIETQIQLDGSQIWLETNKVPLRNPEGKVIGVVGTYYDVTDRQQAQIALNQTNQQLEMTVGELQRATRLKDEFLATMSHELRTPLNAILGMSEALLEQLFGSLNERQLKSLKTIERSGKHLLSLINDILDVSKISAGKLELDIATISLAKLCNSSLAFVRQQAYQKQIYLDLQLPPVPGTISVDERRMRQVAINLLGNAVKFTPQGGRISLSVTRSPSDNNADDRCWVEFAFTDTGIGIASADLDKLFQPFVQLDSSFSRQYEGTGLGLMLVKQIVELHGGSVSVQSEIGRGSCFTVRLPQKYHVSSLDGNEILTFDTSTEDPDRLDDTATSVSALILLAEDNKANIQTISSYLIAKGYRTILAETGHEAIELARTDRPDLILMDIQMPEMDGIEAIGWIRQNPQLAKIPIIALTALAMEGDREKCLAAGATEYLSKPVKLKQLLATIQQLIRR